MQNEEADALTNGDFRHFAAAKRIPVSLETLEFRVMNKLFAEGEEYERELAEQKAAQKAERLRHPGGRREGKVRPDQTLRKRNPW